MSKKKTNTEVYLDIIAAIATKSASKIEGVEILSGNNACKRFSNGVMAYIKDDKVTLDIFINMHYGHNIPNTVCAVQESIKKNIETETCYKVDTINVKVVNIIVNEESVTPIKHVFDENDIEDSVED